MKTKQNLPLMPMLVLAGALTLTACQKQNLAADDDNDNTESTEQAFSENASADIANIGSNLLDNGAAAARGSSAYGKLGECASIKRDTVLKIDTLIFNGGSCLDGRTRSGMLIFNYSASANGARYYRNPGFKCQITSLNYKVDDRLVNKVEKTIENTTPANFAENNGNLTWKISGVVEIACSKGTHRMTFTRYKTLLNTADATVYHGQQSPISWEKARVGVTGEASGTNAKGKNFNCTITNPLIRDFGACEVNGRHPFIAGTLELTADKRGSRTVDFGDGSCDNLATVTVNNRTRTIELK